MSDLKNDASVQPRTPGKAIPEESESMRRLEKDADEMAGKAEETEEKYDDDHGIFTK
jgi:hypothetical protein